MADVVQPPSSTPMVSASTGHALPAWINWFLSLVAVPVPVEVQTLSGSPFEFTASAPGSLQVSGGTVSVITITRGRDTFSAGVTSGFIPVGRDDIVEITYTVAPSVRFIPN